MKRIDERYKKRKMKKERKEGRKMGLVYSRT
jgi:hypothetical protein